MKHNVTKAQRVSSNWPSTALDFKAGGDTQESVSSSCDQSFSWYNTLFCDVQLSVRSTDTCTTSIYVSSGAQFLQIFTQMEIESQSAINSIDLTQVGQSAVSVPHTTEENHSVFPALAALTVIAAMALSIYALAGAPFFLYFTFLLCMQRK